MKSNPDTTTAAPLRGKARKAALAARAKQRQREKRMARHERLDGWTEPEKRMDTAERIAAYLTKRVEFPKYGEPRKLTKTDRDEARACVFLALVQGRFFEHGMISFRLLRACRNALNSAQGLRLQRRRETLSDDIAATAAEAGFVTEYEETGPRLTRDQRDTARVIMRTLRASREADASRKANQNFRSNREFFMLTLGILTGRTPRAMSGGAFRTRKGRFLDYLAQGAAALRSAPIATNDAARDILRALESRAFAE